MSTFRIVCARLARETEHEHIVAVGVVTEAGDPVELWTVAQARTVMFAGDFLYTEGDGADDISWVEAYTCECGATTLRSDPDSTATTSLAAVPACADDDECATFRATPEPVRVVDLNGLRRKLTRH